MACRECQNGTAALSGVDHSIRVVLRQLERGRGSVDDLSQLKAKRSQALERNKAHSESHGAALRGT